MVGVRVGSLPGCNRSGGGRRCVVGGLAMLVGAGAAGKVMRFGLALSIEGLSRSDTPAMISPASPQLLQLPSTAIRRPVFLTDSAIVSYRRGLMTRRSMTSARIPSAFSCSAASRQRSVE